MAEPIDMKATLRRFEQVVVEQRMVFLAEQVRALPMDAEDKASVLQLIDEVTAVREPDRDPHSPRSDFLALSGSPTAAAFRVVAPEEG